MENSPVVNSEEVTENAKMKIDDARPLAFNRKMKRRFTKMGIDFRVVEDRQQAVNTKKEFKVFKSELAFTHGSKTGKFKKKHLDRELRTQGVRND